MSSHTILSCLKNLCTANLWFGDKSLKPLTALRNKFNLSTACSVVNKGQISSIQNGVAAVDCGNDKPISCRSLRPGRDISGGTERNYFPPSSRCTATMSNQTAQFDLRTSHQRKVSTTSTCKVPTRSLH